MSDNRTKNSTKNMIMGFSYQVVTLVLSFVSRTVFIHILGKEFLGLNGIFSDVLTLLSMADLGFGTAMAYTFYKPLAEKDESTIVGLITFYRKLYNIIAGVVLVLGLVCIPFLKYIINTEENIPHIEIYYIISLLGVVTSYMFVYKTTLLSADQKNYKLVTINMITSVVKTLLQIISLLIINNYIIYLVIGLLINVINNLIASSKTEKEYPFLKNKISNKSVDIVAKTKIFDNMKAVFIYKISGTLFNATDNVIISTIVGTAMVGLYSNYLMLSNKLLLVEQIVFSAMTASVGNVIATEKSAKRLQIFNTMQAASYIFCGIITSCFALLVNDVIFVWIGKEFQLSELTVIAITVNSYLACVLQPLWVYRDAAGIYKKTKYVMLMGAIINILLSFILGYKIGLAGIIFASAIARLSSYFWYEPRILFREYFESTAREYFVSLLLNALAVVGIVIVFSIIFSRYTVSGIWSLLLKCLIIGVGSVVLFLLLYMKTEGFQIIMNKVKSMLKGKKE